MQFKSLDFFNNHFANEQMNFLFTGDFTDELTDQLIELNNCQFRNSDEFKGLQRRAAFLIAECFQNIVRHSDLSNIDSYFHIKHNFGVFSLISGNTIEKEIVPILKSQIEQLNKLTTSELREAFRKTLEGGNFSVKGGAGLGLIEMARKTKNKLNFRFPEVNDIKSYFYFQLVLHAVEFITNPEPGNFDNDILLKERMREDDLFLVYQGIISTEVNSVLLKIVEDTFDSPEQKTVFLQLLSFIEKVSAELTSIEIENSMTLIVGENDSEYNMLTSSIVSNVQAKKIDRTYKLYNSLDQESLLKERSKLLKDGKQDNMNKYNSYLIELFINSVNVEIDLKSHSDKLSFLSFTVAFEKKTSKAINPPRQSGQNSNYQSIAI